MISIFAFCDELDNGDRNCGYEDHMNVTTLVQNKLEEDPEYHQEYESKPH
jgi:hypothetical protein